MKLCEKDQRGLWLVHELERTERDQQNTRERERERESKRERERDRQRDSERVKRERETSNKSVAFVCVSAVCIPNVQSLVQRISQCKSAGSASALHKLARTRTRTHTHTLLHL